MNCINIDIGNSNFYRKRFSVGVQINTKEELEEFLAPKDSVVAGINVTRYGEYTNRVMILALGDKNEFTDKMAKAISLLCVPRGYELIRIDGTNVADEIASIYDEIRKEQVFKETIAIKKKFGFGAGGKYEEKLLDKKRIYCFAYGDAVPNVINGLYNYEINRFYFVSPNLKDVYNKKSFKWHSETEILLSENDKELLEDAKRFVRRYTAHLTVKPADAGFKGDSDLVLLESWLTGERNNKYGGNPYILAFIVVGFFVGYLFDLFIIKGQHIANNNMPIGAFMGVLLALFIEEVWRRR